MLGRVIICVASVVLAAYVSWQPPLRAQAVRTQVLSLQTSLAPRTSLRVSTSRLRFDVAADGSVTGAAADYRAAARTAAQGRVVLTIQPDGALVGPGGSAATGLAVRCGEAAGAAPLKAGRSQVVGRWTGSGVWQGSVNCRLEGATAPGSYFQPVNFVVALE
jgi:hypothetical protein